MVIYSSFHEFGQRRPQQLVRRLSPCQIQGGKSSCTSVTEKCKSLKKKGNARN
jgi:hypothetical protein